MQERSHTRTFIIIRHCGRKYNAGKYQSNIVEYQGITAKLRNGLAPQRLRVTADIYSHALRGRDQEACPAVGQFHAATRRARGTQRVN
jgi:hypothetical protein